MEKYSFTIPAKPFMGKFFFPPSWLRHSGRENPIPNSLQMRNSSYLSLGLQAPNIYESDLSNEVLYILVSQEAAKIFEVQFAVGYFTS